MRKPKIGTSGVIVMHASVQYTSLIVLVYFILLKHSCSLLLSRVGNYEIIRSELVLQQSIKKQVIELGGCKTWNWKGNQINYLNSGIKKSTKSPLLLIHGLVAPSFHWRNNIPELAKKYDIYAMDLLGMGLSDKPLTKNSEYGEPLWRDQVLDFIQQVIAKDSMCTENGKQVPCVLAGTGIGGAIALAAATSSVALEKNLVAGLILLNSQSHFQMPPEGLPREHGDASTIQMLRRDLWHEYRSDVFIYKQYLRNCVYPVRSKRADDELMECIRQQMAHPNAANIWQNIAECGGKGPEALTDDCLAKLKVPLLLIWGTQDTWLKPPVADRIQRLYPQALRVDLHAGHCVHDEAPQPVNQAMDIFLQGIHDKQNSNNADGKAGSKVKDTREVAGAVRTKIAALQAQIHQSETVADSQSTLQRSLLNVLEKSAQVVVQIAKYGHLLSKYDVNTDAAVGGQVNDALQVAWDGVAVAEEFEKLFRLACATNNIEHSAMMQNAQDYVAKLRAFLENVNAVVSKGESATSTRNTVGYSNDIGVPDGPTNDALFSHIEEEQVENSPTALVDTTLEAMKRILKTGDDVALSLSEEDNSEGASLGEDELHVELLRAVKVAQGLATYALQFLGELNQTA